MGNLCHRQAASGLLLEEIRYYLFCISFSTGNVFRNVTRQFLKMFLSLYNFSTLCKYISCLFLVHFLYISCTFLIYLLEKDERRLRSVTMLTPGIHFLLVKVVYSQSIFSVVIKTLAHYKNFGRNFDYFEWCSLYMSFWACDSNVSRPFCPIICQVFDLTDICQ